MEINRITSKTSFEGKKVPRYLYHITTKTNYGKMKKSGYILMSKDYLSQKHAIFLLDWQNFLKQWGGLAAGKKTPFLSKKTFFEYILRGKNGSNISILRIPTSNLQQNKLFIRSQDVLFDMCQNYQAEYRTRDIILKKKFPHLFNFDLAKNSKKYKQKKHSIEYIYTNTIPISVVEEIGTANLTQKVLKNSNNLLVFLKKILLNSKENKSLNIFKNSESLK